MSSAALINGRVSLYLEDLRLVSLHFFKIKIVSAQTCPQTAKEIYNVYHVEALENLENFALYIFLVLKSSKSKCLEIPPKSLLLIWENTYMFSPSFTVFNDKFTHVYERVVPQSSWMGACSKVEVRSRYTLYCFYCDQNLPACYSFRVDLGCM